MSDPSIGCVGVVKHFAGHPILDGISLEVANGSVTTILGASGSGKTTLLRIIMGFVGADSGTVTIGGRLCSDSSKLLVPPEKRNVGYVAQEGALFPHLTAGQNIAFGLPRSERKSSPRVDELLQLVGLGVAIRDRYPHLLSGGEQRRVALARAMAPKPQAILFDEPFTGLDAGLRTETRNAVVNALSTTGTTALLVTHDPAEALSLGDQVAVLRGGKLVQTGTPSAIYQEPVDIETAGLVGETVVIDGNAAGEMADSVMGMVTLHQPAQGRVQLLIRPEQIQIAGEGVQAIVTGASYFGRQTVMSLSIDGVTVHAGIASQTPPEIGTKVSVVVTGKVVAYPTK
jgi:iron(III) transport system ATP-binding protein